MENSILAKEKNINKNKIQRDIILNFYKNYYKEYITSEGNKFWICSYLYYDTNILRCLKDIDKGWINCEENDIKFYNEKKEEEEKIIKKQDTNPYGYYGKFNGDNFCITEVDEEALKKYEETGDGRVLKTGVKCNTGQYQKPGLLHLVINVFKIPIPSESRGDIENNKKLWKDIKNEKNNKLKAIMESKYLDIIGEKDHIDEIDKNEINRIYYFIKQTGPVKCQIIKEFLEEKKLYLEDKDCGIQGKSKIDKHKDKDKEAEKEKKKEEREEKKAKREREKEREKQFKKQERERNKKNKKNVI